jgi:hypothetical protein
MHPLCEIIAQNNNEIIFHARIGGPSGARRIAIRRKRAITIRSASKAARTLDIFILRASCPTCSWLALRGFIAQRNLPLIPLTP